MARKAKERPPPDEAAEATAGGPRQKGLTSKQQRFVDEYLVDCNATQAAIRAGYSAKFANREGSRLLSNVDVQASIAEARQRLSESTELTQEWVLARLKAEALNYDEGSTHSARVRSVELIGKHLGMFVENVNVRGSGKDGAVRHEHDVGPDLLGRIEQLAGAFEELADRTGEGGVPGDGPEESLDPPEVP